MVICVDYIKSRILEIIIRCGGVQGQRSQRWMELAGAGGGAAALEMSGVGVTEEELRREVPEEAVDGSGLNSTRWSPDSRTLKNRAERER